MIFFTLALHVPLLFSGVYPFFGRYLFDLGGTALLDLSILLLALLAWGVFRRKLWAWWGSVIYFGLMILSSGITFLTTSKEAILEGMRFAPLELDIMHNVPFQSYHLVFVFTLPLFITLMILVFSKPHFGNVSDIDSVS